MNSNEEANKEWAHAFSTIGRKSAREILYFVANKIQDGERSVIEFRETESGEKAAIPTTEYVEKLEGAVDFEEEDFDKK